MVKWDLNSLVFCALFAFGTMLMPTLTANANSLAEQLVKLNQKQLANEGHAGINAQNSDTQLNYITLTVEELSDNTGLKYLAGIVNRNDVAIYTQHLKLVLGEDYEVYRAAQKLRDHGKFHITLVNPYEYEALTEAQLSTLKPNMHFTFKLLGLGQVKKADGATYFVVAKSHQAQNFRQMLSLKPKDFHVTLGFKPQDIYGVRKNEETLIN